MRKIVPYNSEFRSDCIEIFRGNIGLYFAEDELQGFVDLLDHNLGDKPYFVVLLDDEVIGCGGYRIKGDVVRLMVGMINSAHHKTGAGKQLLIYRLNHISKNLPGYKIELETSQHTEGFFKKFGFVTTGIVKDFYGVGIDKVSMSRKS
jgi:predicted GNAT family N-acyltransferase